MARKNPYTDKYKQDYQKERKRAATLIKRYQKKGFQFIKEDPESGGFIEEKILPDKPKRITKASVERLKKITPEYLKEKAKFFVTPEGELVKANEYKKYATPKQSEAQKNARLINIAKAQAKNKAVSRVKEEEKKFKGSEEEIRFQKAQARLETAQAYKKLYTGEALFDRWKKIYLEEGEEAAQNFVDQLNENDFELLNSAYRRRYDEIPKRSERRDQRETPENVVSDERSESDEGESEDNQEDYSGKEQYGWNGAESEDDYDEGYSDEEDEGYEDEEYEKPKQKRKTFRDEIEEEIERNPKFKKWKDELERQRKIPVKDREYVYEGDQVYFNIIEKIKQFEIHYNSESDAFRDKHYNNLVLSGNLMALLEDQFARYGKDNVLRRMQNYAFEINDLMDKMLYAYKDNIDVNAFNRLAYIIKGEALNVEESQAYTEYGEMYASSFEEGDEDYNRV